MSEHHREIERLRQENEELKREKEQAQAREEHERREKEDAKRKNQKTTLEEYLHNCHFHLYKKLGLADQSKSSTGFTKVEGKYYPKWLRPWSDFTNTQRQQQFEEIRRICGERRLFHQESTTKNMGTTISRKLAGNENAIDHFEKLAVEDPAWEILSAVRDEEELRKELRFMGLRFSNNLRDFTQPDGTQAGAEDPNEESQERRRRTGPNKRVASEHRVKPPPTKPDGGGFVTRLSGEERLCFVYDYKAAHKVAVEYLKPAIAKEKLFMEVIERMNCDKTRTDAELRGQDKAEALIAMGLTQVFDYMVRYGVAYGYVAAGESLLFLHVDRADPLTLYCHPCLPDEEVGEAATEDLSDRVSHSAVGQLASFCLLSLRSEALQGASLDVALQRAEGTLRKWREPYEDAARLLEAVDSCSSFASSSQATEGSEFTSNAGPTGRDISLRSKSSCRAAAVLCRDGEDEEEDGPEDGFFRSRRGADANKRKEGPSSGSSEDEDAEMSDSIPARQYCTQACLLGLKRGWDLDGKCPNVLSHRTAEGSNQHPIDADDFAHLVNERLRQDPYRGCRALNGWGKMGSTGVLFKLELAPYGYTFVGKGTLSGYLPLLQYESRIYAHLDRLQGEVVPVHLGLARLDGGYVLPGGARVVHMMLMSWGGEVAADAARPGAGDLAAEVRRSSQAVWAEGVDHGDEHGGNQLWNDERRCVMLVDFDRATLLPALKHKQLSRVSGKKRKWQGDVFENNAPKRGVLDHVH